MKVHFGGSGKGFKELRNEYLLIRKSIRSQNVDITRDWIVLGDQKSSMSQAYTETVLAIKKSDGVIIEGTIDSSSIGKQLTISLDNHKPVLLLVKKGKVNPSNLSEFVNDKQKLLIQVSNYSDQNIVQIIKSFIKVVERNHKKARFNLELDRNLDNYLSIKSKELGESKAGIIRSLIQKDMERNSG